MVGPGIEAIRSLCEQAVFDGEVDAVTTAERELDAFAADLALARGQVRHARFLTGGSADGGAAARSTGGSGAPHQSEPADFEEAAERYERLSDGRGLAEALAQGRVDDASRLLDDADAITTRVGAHQVRLSVDEVRTALADAR